MINYYCALTEEQYSKESSIKARRRFDSLKGLPVGAPVLGYIDNDLATGSWWFVIGGIISMMIPLVILLDSELNFFKDERNAAEIIEAADDSFTWWLLLVSGFFVTVGSYCFVRAFTEPTPSPLGDGCVDQCSYFSLFGICIRTDEILAAWLFLAGSLPAMPYAGIFCAREPTRPAYILGLMAAAASVLCAGFFVWAVIQPVELEHPSDKFPPSVSSLSLSSHSTTNSSIPENEEVLTTPLTTPLDIVEAGNHHHGTPGSQMTSKDYAASTQASVSTNHDLPFRTVDISSTATGRSRRQVSVSPLKSKLMIPVVETMVEKVVGKQSSFILMHISTDFLLASWLSLFVSIAWGVGSLALLVLKNADMSSRVDFAYIMSFIDSLPFVIGSIYYISGGFYYAGTESEGFQQVAPREVEDLPEKNPLHKEPSPPAQESVEKEVPGDEGVQTQEQEEPQEQPRALLRSEDEEEESADTQATSLE